jgi:pimeloyl-ACP methyl ester carboxylesterase
VRTERVQDSLAAFFFSGLWLVICVSLVGSATRREEVNWLLAALHPLAQVAPLDWLRRSAGGIPAELARMFATCETSFVRAMCSAIFTWEGLGACAARVLRIHGRHDLVIPPPSRADLLLDGGHLISVSHPRECSEFIRANEAVQRT